MPEGTSRSSTELDLETSSTALVLVDLQGFTVPLPTKPHTGEAVLAKAIELADACRAAGVLVVLIQASAGVGAALALAPPSDAAMPMFETPPGSERLPADLGPRDGDVVVTKYNWGAFYGTDLDLQLRRRGISTLIVGGIATNFGVESTVRQAHEAGYAQIVVSDAVAAFTQPEHDASMRWIIPRIARVRSAADVLLGLRAVSE